MKVLFSALLVTVLLASLMPLGIQAESPTNPTAYRITLLGDARLVYIDDTVLTAADFGRYMDGSGLMPTGRRDMDLDTLESALEFMIDQWVIMSETDSTAIYRERFHHRKARWRMANAAGPLAFKHDIVPIIHVSDEEVQKFYQDSLETMFTTPQRRELRHLLISPKWHFENGKQVQYQADHADALTIADSLKKEIEAGASMADIARANSADSGSRAAGGYLGWVFPGNTTYDFDTAAFAAELNEIRGPIKSIYGYHLIRVEGIRPESTIVLTDSLAALIRSQLAFDQGRKLGNVWADSVIKAAVWEYNDQWLDGDMQNIPDTMWMVKVNHRDTLVYQDWKWAWEFYKRQMSIEGAGTLEDKHRSLRKSAFPYLYLHAAEDQEYADDSLITAERMNYARSVQLHQVRAKLSQLEEFPPLDSMRAELKGDQEGSDELKLEMVRASDTAAIWGAYRALTAGKSMATVAQWYHDNMRETAHRDWDLGWVAKEDIPSDALGRVWILSNGGFTRPFEVDGKYYIYRLLDRRSPKVDDGEVVKRYKDALSAHQHEALKQWRREIRAGHAIRRDPATWRRIVRLFRK